jgi:hypothetical protein
MFHVEGNKAKQLLTVSYSWHVGADQMPFCVEKIKDCLVDMEPGFRLLADFSHMAMMAPSCRVYLAEIMDLCSAKGVSIVVRVIPDPHKDIGLSILSFFHYGPHVQIMTYEKLEQAMQSLAA